MARSAVETFVEGRGRNLNIELVQTLDLGTPPPDGAATPAPCPLFVDLDGTLVATDLLWESVALFVRHYPFEAWRLPLWVLGGKTAFKRRLAERVRPDAALLPYREDVLAF